MEFDPGGLDHQSSRLLGIGRPHPDVADLLPAVVVLVPHSFQCPHATFVPGPSGLDPRPDPAFLLGQLAVKFGVLLLLGIEQGLPPFQERRVVTGQS